MTLSPRRERAHAGGGRPPPPDPLLLPGTFGAPAALPFGPVRDAGDLGKIGSFARAEPIATRHVMSAPLFARGRAHAGGGRPPPPRGPHEIAVEGCGFHGVGPDPLLLPGTFGAPAALPFGPVRDAGDLGKIDSIARAEPIATRHVMSARLFARGRAHAGGGRPPPPRGPHEIAVEGCGFHGVGPDPLLLPGTFGAPAALPFGPVRD